LAARARLFMTFFALAPGAADGAAVALPAIISVAAIAEARMAEEVLRGRVFMVLLSIVKFRRTFRDGPGRHVPAGIAIESKEVSRLRAQDA